MRAAPESLVQTILAELLAEIGVKLLLEVSLTDLRLLMKGQELAEGDASKRTGRVDLVVYYKSTAPRFIIEIKKLHGKGQSLLADCRRLHDLLAICPTVQNGLMLGYTVAVKPETIKNRIAMVADVTGSRIVRKLPPLTVTSKRGASRLLGAAVYRVEREQVRP